MVEMGGNNKKVKKLALLVIMYLAIPGHVSQIISIKTSMSEVCFLPF